MTHFTPDYLDFFTELAFNNEKSWFDVNRKRYEQSVREPFKAFTAEVIAGVKKFDDTIGDLEPKDVMFRINRDIRFAKDKTPYNTWLSAAIVPGGKRRSSEFPGYYFRFAVDKVSIGGGMFHPVKEELLAIRRKIARDPQAIHKVLKGAKYKKVWGSELTGEENKVLPKEFKEAAVSEPLIKKKSFAYWHDLPETEVLRDDLLQWMLEQFKAGKPLNDYLGQHDS